MSFACVSHSSDPLATIAFSSWRVGGFVLLFGFFFYFFVVAVGFRLQSMKFTVTDGKCTQYASHTRLFTWCHTMLHGSRCCACVKTLFPHPFMQSSLLFPSSTSSTFISTSWHSSCPTSSTPTSGPLGTKPCGSIPRQEERGPLAQNPLSHINAKSQRTVRCAEASQAAVHVGGKW